MAKEQNNWEKDFDKKFIQFENGIDVGGFEVYPYPRVKSFIKTLLEDIEVEHSKELKEVYKEGVKETVDKNKEVLERLKLEFDVVVCKCGDEWKEAQKEIKPYPK